MYIEGRQGYNDFVFENEEDAILKSAMTKQMEFSRRFISSIKRCAYITVNGKDIPVNGMVKKGDIIRVVLPDEYSNYQLQEKDIDVVYEDDDIMIVDKPAFMAVHPTKSHLNSTLLNYLLYEFEKRGIKSKPRFVSRLDYNTSGLVTVAKNAFAHHMLSMGPLAGAMKKYYLAVVHGIVETDRGVLDFPIDKSEDGIKRIVSNSGKEAITYYENMGSYGKFTLLKLRLGTGRTHQIRVHLSYIGHIIVGDILYGSDYEGIDRQSLHCFKVNLISPRSKKCVTATSKMPQDIRNILSGYDINY